MSYLMAADSTNNTAHLLSKLDQTIEEAKLVSQIIEVGNQAREIEVKTGPSRQSNLLRKQVAALKQQLRVLRYGKPD